MSAKVFPISKIMKFKGDEGRGCEYQYFCAAFQGKYHSFIILWDEDRDERIIPRLQNLFMYAPDAAAHISVVGERKGSATVISHTPYGPGLEALKVIAQQFLSEGPDGDSWGVETFFIWDEDSFGHLAHPKLSFQAIKTLDRAAIMLSMLGDSNEDIAS